MTTKFVADDPSRPSNPTKWHSWHDCPSMGSGSRVGDDFLIGMGIVTGPRGQCNACKKRDAARARKVALRKRPAPPQSHSPADPELVCRAKSQIYQVAIRGTVMESTTALDELMKWCSRLREEIYENYKRYDGRDSIRVTPTRVFFTTKA